MAGPVRFELTMGFPTPVFKTGAFNRSATDPRAAHDITEQAGCRSLWRKEIETYRRVR